MSDSVLVCQLLCPNSIFYAVAFGVSIQEVNFHRFILTGNETILQHNTEHRKTKMFCPKISYIFFLNCVNFKIKQ